MSTPFDRVSAVATRTCWCTALLWLNAGPMPCPVIADAIMPIPFVKRWQPHAGTLTLAAAAITTAGGDLGNERIVLEQVLRQRDLPVQEGGTPIRLEIAPLDVPVPASAHAAAIRRQGYRLLISAAGIRIQASSDTGVFYGIQTLVQLLDCAAPLPRGEIIDWPDLSVRGIMVDPARANENAAYYTRLIRFCGRYKINRLHLHLTDDQNVSLYHEDYSTLMHPHAWRPEQLRELVRLAQQRHIELVPEIESLGHGRVFLRHADYADILHQTAETRAGTWTGTDVPGYTNVLCPASPQTYAYLERMYARAAEALPAAEIHIGCDEVDLTRCARCAVAFPGITHPEWFRRHLLRCRALVAGRGCRTALWGDMLLKHREILDGLPTHGTVIYDWHYGPDVSDASVKFFTDRGFEVVGCPALMCHPHLIFPAADSYENIRRFAEIAREQGIQGIDTTIWIPQRYLSDVLWPGIAYAAGEAWTGGVREEALFGSIMQDLFGTVEEDTLAWKWTDLALIDWQLPAFRTSCWTDDASRRRARQEATQDLGAAARRRLAQLAEIRAVLARLRGTITRNPQNWAAIEQSAAILAYVLEHLLLSVEAWPDGQLDRNMLRQSDERCMAALGWIEADWDRNRFADDPDKADLHRTGQHLLNAFRRMHAYHVQLLADAPPRQTSSGPSR